MSVYEKIDQDTKEAMLSKNQERLGVLRLLKSAFKNAEIAKGGPLTDAEVLSQLEKQAKQRKDSIDQYKKGSRDDLAEKEQFELEIILKYLPQKMTREEAEKLVNEVITDLGVTDISGMGNVMKEVRDRANGSIDGGMASEIVKGKLS